MSLIGSVVRVVPKVFGYTKRLAKASPYIIFGDAAHGGVRAASAVTKTADMSIAQYFKNVIKAGGRGIEKSVAKTQSAVGKNFFKAFLNSMKEVPTVLKTSVKWTAGRSMVAAKAAGKTGFALKLAGLKGGFKGIFKGIGKKLPLIGNLMLVAFQLKNIISATKEKGIGQGVAETVKTGARLTGASIASAIGTAVAGPIGGIAGFIIGDWLTSKIVGKSYTEKKDEEAEKDAEAIERVQRMQQEGTIPTGVAVPGAQVAQPTFTGNPFGNDYQSNPFNYDNFSNPYANDIFMQNMKFDTLA